jgi:hypothetical protein
MSTYRTPLTAHRSLLTGRSPLTATLHFAVCILHFALTLSVLGVLYGDFFSTSIYASPSVFIGGSPSSSSW